MENEGGQQRARREAEPDVQRHFSHVRPIGRHAWLTEDKTHVVKIAAHRTPAE